MIQFFALEEPLGVKRYSPRLNLSGAARADDPDFRARRASNDYDGIGPLAIADRLMPDEHDLVLKGYGWMLKSLSQVDQPCVAEYWIKHHKRTPRVAYRYALENLIQRQRTNCRIKIAQDRPDRS